MDYYRVLIFQKSDPLGWESKSDLTREKLERRIVDPYRIGRPITVNGKTIRTEDIDRVRVYRTEISWQEMCLMADHNGRNVDSVFSEMAEDVTDEWVTGAPGSGSLIETKESAAPSDVADAGTVFVVHGRNEEARRALFVFLRSIGLRPLGWSEAVKATDRPMPYIGQILDAAFSRAHAVVVLLTPDDEARLRRGYGSKDEPPHEVELTGQARPNVLFEAGMAMGRNHERTILVELGAVRPFSDVAGIHVIRLDHSSQRRQELAQRLQTAGCPVNLEGTDWHTAGDFRSVLERMQESSDPSAVAEGRSSTDATTSLSEEARQLLSAAAAREGSIYKIRSAGGLIVRVSHRSFGETGNRRSEAMWEGGIDDLVRSGLVHDPKGEDKWFQVTREGYAVAKQLST